MNIITSLTPSQRKAISSATAKRNFTVSNNKATATTLTSLVKRGIGLYSNIATIEVVILTEKGKMMHELLS